MDGGGIDCDVHPALPGLSALLPYLDAYWREQITVRGIGGLAQILLVKPLHRLPGQQVALGEKVGGGVCHAAIDGGVKQRLTAQLWRSPIAGNQAYHCGEVAAGTVATDGNTLAVDAEGCGLPRDP